MARINRAVDHITQHLADPLRLEDVARVACFSPFHFHRVFRGLVGETLHDFVKRTRLERALHLMAHSPGMRLTDVALACGFTSSSDFSRSFRARYGVAPRRFPLDTFRRENRDRMVRSLKGGADLSRRDHDDNPDAFEVRVRELPARSVAYVRVFRPYEGGVLEASTRLQAWADRRGLGGGAWLGFQWDDPEIVPMEQCRYDLGVVVPDGTVVEEPLGLVRFPTVRVAELPLRGPIELEMRALDWLFDRWLPTSGLVPDHQPVFEAWVGRPFAHGTSLFELALHLPVTEGAALGV